MVIWADDPPAGKCFDYWESTSNEVIFDNMNAKQTSFRAPDHNVTVTAHYRDLPEYLLTVENGSGGGYIGVDYYALVTITANAAPAGTEFDKWVTDDEDVIILNPTSASAFIYMPQKDVTVTATYKNDPKTADPGKDGDGKDGGMKAGQAKVSSVKTLPKLYLVKGKSIKLPASVQPYNAANKNVTFKSKNKKIVKVDKKTGKLTAGKKAAGKSTKITVTTTDGNKIATCKVYVVKKPVKLKKMTISQKAKATLAKGKTLQLKPKLKPAKATGKKAIVPTYKSSDTKIAVIDKTGVITALKPGKTTITVKAGVKKKTFILTVK